MDGVAADKGATELPEQAHRQAPPRHAASTWAEILPARTAPQRLGHHWTDLSANASEPNAFAEPWFADAALRHLDPASDAQILEVWSSHLGEPFLIGLLLLRIAQGYSHIPVRYVENWLHNHSFLGTPAVRAGRERDFWSAAMAALDRSAWATNFLHLRSLVEDGPVHRGLVAAANELGRPCDTVYRRERALLQSSLSPEDYYVQTVRKKKRKELKRLSSRLSELGAVKTRTLAAEADLDDWCDAFLELERSGWKGDFGSALACDRSTELFFREALAGAYKAGKLDFLRLDLDGRPIAMLVNFLTAPGSFSFKIAFDEDYARFSPGVLIQIKNYGILERDELRWMDSCAVAEHPMINSLWGQRRPIVRVTVPLGRPLHRLTFRLCRLLENSSAKLRQLRGGNVLQQQGQNDD
jgi:CelD/BcsL family acetyltransferase involved in cellulose biosynthesis